MLLLFSCWVVSNSLKPHGLKCARFPCPSPSPGVCSNSCRVSDAIQSSYPLSSPSPPAVNLSQNRGLFQWVGSSHQGDQSIGASSSASAFPMNNIWGLFPLGFTGLISLQSNRLSRVFKTTVWMHQFFGTQPSLWSNSHIHTWLLKKPGFD